jgi:hypothetical protein
LLDFLTPKSLARCTSTNVGKRKEMAVSFKKFGPRQGKLWQVPEKCFSFAVPSDLRKQWLLLK